MDEVAEFFKRTGLNVNSVAELRCKEERTEEEEALYSEYLAAVKAEEEKCARKLDSIMKSADSMINAAAETREKANNDFEAIIKEVLKREQ